MKKILFLSGLFLSLIPTISQSSPCGEKKSHHWNEVHQYFMKEILPVLNEKRAEFDSWLDESERNELNDCRSQILHMKENLHRTRIESREEFPEKSATMLTDESRTQKHILKKELFGRIHTIAKNHHDELDQIFTDLTVQRKKWMDDISKLLEMDEEKEFYFLQNSVKDHHGPLGMWSRAAFLLLDASKSIIANEESKIAG